MTGELGTTNLLLGIMAAVSVLEALVIIGLGVAGFMAYRKVMELVAEGRRNKEIASLLGISEETVQVHLKNIFAKLKVSERTAALNVALRRGIVHIK